MSDALTPVRGNGIWIWQLSNCEGGNLDAIVTRLKSNHVDNVILKAADGVDAWQQWNAQTIGKLKAAGIKVIGWQYSYGPKKDVAAEVAVASRQIALGADGWIVDAEIEYEQAGGIDAAKSYCQGILHTHANLCFGLSTFGLPTYHSGFPYLAFKEAGCLFWSPQVYWRAWGYTDPVSAVNDTIGSIVRDGRCRHWPLLPTGQAYSDNSGMVTDVMMHLFAAICSHRWVSLGLNWWSYEDLPTVSGNAWREISEFPRSRYGL
jgi:hypothetical protein